MNTGYAQFKSTQASRPVMVYAAANDGMLHALNGTDGTEQFAYVPSGVFQGPTGTPQVNGLAALGNPAFAHHDYVDATPVMFDLDLARAGGATPSDPTTSNWATFLIGGLGKGGKSFYALDITNPGSMTDETTVAGKVKWEFTDATMGYSYGQANVFKTTQFGWVVALTSGYNNSDGYGYLYLVNPATGALLKKIRTPSASNGLTYASAFAPDGGDGTADSLYAGDLNGQIWRFDLRTASGDYPAPTLLATLTDGSQNAQPITVAPHIDVHPVNRKRYIMLGTGQLLSSLDLNTSAAQSVYAIADGNNGTFNTIGLPITRSTLQAVTDLTVGIPSTVSTTAAGKGWYADLGVNSSTNAGVTTTVAWRVVTQESDSQNGIVNFNALLPQGDPCSPGGRSNVYGINFATGKTVLAGNAPYLALTKAVVNVQFFRNLTTGKTEMIAGDTTGRLTNVDGNFDPGIATKLLNWREIPTAE
jgi:type IV pilus assembly protein PilY1